MLCTWSSEQAIREIYLKPFELSVKEGGTTAIMSSYNYIGTQWAGACSNLLSNVLREEWGFKGSVLTDYFANFGYMDATRAIYNGGDTCLINRDVTTNYVTDLDDSSTVLQMRRACKNVLYTAVNSRGLAEENLTTGPMTWQIILFAVDVVIALALVLLELTVVQKGYAKGKETAEAEHKERFRQPILRLTVRDKTPLPKLPRFLPEAGQTYYYRKLLPFVHKKRQLVQLRLYIKLNSVK